MPIRYTGYACLNVTLRGKGKNEVFTSRGLTLKSFCIERASAMSLQNVIDLTTILKWNAAHNIRFMRVTSNFFPFMTHADVGYHLDQLEHYEGIKTALREAGQFAKDNGMRINSHPGPFTILASPNEKVVEATIRDIEMHSAVMDLMGFPADANSNINFHMGSDYGDKKETARRYVENLARLSQNARQRISVENDDKGKLFSVRELYDLIYQASGVPVVFDVHHHRFNTGGMTDVGAAKLAFSTWGKVATPEMHYSESRTADNSVVEGKVVATAHSDYILEPLPDYDDIYDVMVESKQKELALLKHREKYAYV